MSKIYSTQNDFLQLNSSNIQKSFEENLNQIFNGAGDVISLLHDIRVATGKQCDSQFHIECNMEHVKELVKDVYYSRYLNFST